MKKKILFALLSTTMLNNNLLGSDFTCTTTTEERAALETSASIVTVEQQRFSQPNLFSFPFFEPLTRNSPAPPKVGGENTRDNHWMESVQNNSWINNVKEKQKALDQIVAAGLRKKIDFAQCEDQTSDAAKAMICDAKACFLRAAEGGSHQAMIFLSDIYKEQGNFIEAFYWCFLGIEVNLIINGSISNSSYQLFKELSQKNEIEQNTEATAIIPIVESLKKGRSTIPCMVTGKKKFVRIPLILEGGKENKTERAAGTIFFLFSGISYFLEKNPFIASQQITGLARIADYSVVWEQYGSYLEKPFMRSDLPIGSIEREREQYKSYAYSQEYFLMTDFLIKSPSLFEEFHNDIKDENINTFIGNLFWEQIKKKECLPNDKAKCYANLFNFIWFKNYNLDINRREIPLDKREKFAIQLLEKALAIMPFEEGLLESIYYLSKDKKISPKKAIFYFNKAFNNPTSRIVRFFVSMIQNHEFMLNELGEKISSTEERNEAVGRLYSQAIAKGFQFYSSLLGNLILNNRLKYDQNNVVINTEAEKINIGIKLSYDTLGYISQLNAAKKEELYEFKERALLNIGNCLANKKINTDENNLIVSDEDRSAVCARIFNEAITLYVDPTKRYCEVFKIVFFFHIKRKRINHQLDGTPITSKAQRYEYASKLLREEIQERPDDIYAMYELILMISRNQTNHDEKNNIILSENKIDWMIGKLSLEKMQDNIECKILLFNLLLQKECNLENKKKLYDIVQKAVMAGNTEYFEIMEHLKNSIEIDEKESVLAAKADAISIESDPSIPQIQADDDSSSSSNHDSDSDSDSDEGMTQTSTSHVETSQERALRKAQAKANRLLKSQRLSQPDKTRDFLKKHISQLRKTDDSLIDQKPQKYELLWQKEARSGFDNLLTAHRSNVKDIIDRIKNSKNPYDGAEKLKDDLQGWYSHRISDEHRFVFKLSPDKKQIIIRSCYTHYKK